MTYRLRLRACEATLAAILATASFSASADPKNYEFQLVDPAPKIGDVVLSVRLLDARSGKVVPDAVIFAWRVDMAPDGMASMTAPLEPQASNQPGVYQFRANLPMEGAWRLSLAAKVQGEAETVVGSPILRALP
ncbi:hypothetical protein GCM10008171_28830 [Methylopila jiangsuensis]|uniref:YtkA-like domain-containing protein n=1 Tax=Methylopila jiangsuensis TaxID=586230 RepID=A0A9W6JKZ4_9HYPH|nr:FixH family protein [Methylopila jiangsuensis]MDR6284983.1 hypothetical protein [Methylopila jiangsuensis]GLK77629.1 hypothetical protein GCM10008171_28830 [Methylopila jiangsuensis]